MKKQYTKPSTALLRMEAQPMMAGSGEVYILDTTNKIDDPNDIEAKKNDRYDVWE